MKRMQRVFGDLDTLRFVDGRLDEDRRAAFLSHLAEDPTEAERAAMWSRQNETIRAAFAGVALESVPIALRLGHLAMPAKPSPAAAEVKPAVLTRPTARPAESHPVAPGPSADVAYLKDAARATPRRGIARYRTPVSAALLMAIAMAVLYGAHALLPLPHAPTDVPAESRGDAVTAAIVARAGDAYATYALDPLRPVEFTAAQETQLAHWIKRRLGVSVDVPDLTAEGWTALGGRLVPGTSGPGVFFVFENASGERLGLFAERAAPYPAATVALGPAASTTAAMTWVSGPLAYVLTADKSVDWLARNGQALREKIGRAAG